MVTTVNYPDGLRPAIQAGKKREIPAAFRATNPAVGPFYIENFTDDLPVIWDFNLKFTSFQAQVFFDWFLSPDFADKGRVSFNMPIRIEDGLVDHEVNFLPDGVPQLTSERSGIKTYAVSVMARAIHTELRDGWMTYFYERFGDDQGQLSALDIAMNQSWTKF